MPFLLLLLGFGVAAYAFSRAAYGPPLPPYGSWRAVTQTPVKWTGQYRGSMRSQMPGDPATPQQAMQALMEQLSAQAQAGLIADVKIYPDVASLPKDWDSSDRAAGGRLRWEWFQLKVPSAFPPEQQKIADAVVSAMEMKIWQMVGVA